MYDPERYRTALERIVELFSSVSRRYVEKIAKQIRKIGELNASSINRLLIYRDMSADIGEIRHQLEEATMLGTAGMRAVYDKALNDTMTDPRFAEFVKGNQIPPETNARLQQYVHAIDAQTQGTMMNLSNTTVMAEGYKEAVDKAIVATSSGLDSYTGAAREIIREVGSNGIKVVYESGHRRRIDTAVRQNITNATKQIAQQSAIMMGEDLGYDAFEISAHLRSAPDHEPVQGHVLLKEEFAKMQVGRDFRDVDGRMYEGFRRPIGEWNCGHAISPFSTTHSKRLYTDEQLAEFAEKNKKGIMIGQKHYTIYEAGQYMRKIETQIRREKDIAVAAEAYGNDAMRLECQKNINELSRQYAAVAKASGIREDRIRMTVEGFHAVKV